MLPYSNVALPYTSLHIASESSREAKPPHHHTIISAGRSQPGLPLVEKAV